MLGRFSSKVYDGPDIAWTRIAYVVCGGDFQLVAKVELTGDDGVTRSQTFVMGPTSVGAVDTRPCPSTEPEAS